MERISRIFCFGILIAVCMVGCGSENVNNLEQFNEEMQSNDGEIIDEISDDTKLQEGINDPYLEDVEVLRASDLGIGEYNGQEEITFQEFNEMLSYIISMMDFEKLEIWETDNQQANSSNTKMTRFDGMVEIMLAANILGNQCLDYNNNWTILNNKIGEPWNECISNGDFHDFSTQILMNDGSEWNLDAAAYFYALGRSSQRSGGILFGYDEEENSIHPSDTLHYGDALKALVRFYDSITKLCNFSEIQPISLRDDETDKLAYVPEITYDSLPYFVGTALDNKTYSDWAHHTGSAFKEEDFKILHDLGFNFTRIFVTKDLLLSYDSNEIQVNVAQLENLDDAIHYAIQYDIHICICLYDLPGFKGASMDADGFYDDRLFEEACEVYEMLAIRYQEVPSSILSFNLFNEPWMMSGDTNRYVEVVKEMTKRIHKISPERLIFIDCIPMEGPLYELADEEVAQAFHFYEPDFLITGSGPKENVPWYSRQVWPLPYVNGFMSGSEAEVTLQGEFKKETDLKILLDNNFQNCKLTIYADGEQIFSANLENEEASKGLSLQVSLEKDAKMIRIKNESNGTIQLSSIVLIYPQEDIVGTPIYDNIFSSNWIDVEHRSLTQITCNPYPNDSLNDDNLYSTITVSADGSYENENQKSFEYNSEFLYSFLSDWIAFRDETGIDFMVQEMGVLGYMSQSATLSWLDDFTTLLKDNHIGWTLWSDSWQYLNTNKYGVEFETYYGYQLNREMINTLNQNMK